MILKRYRPIVWVLGLAVALFVGFTTSIVATQARHPLVFGDVGWLPDGWARANLALAPVLAGRQTMPERRLANHLSDRDVSLANSGYAKEPLAFPALAVLGFAAERRGDVATSVKLFERTAGLTRRDQLTNAWLIGHYSRSGNDGAAFAYLLRAFRTDETGRPIYLQAMANAMVDEASIRPLIPLIGANEPWANDFWYRLIANPEALVNGARLRKSIIASPYRLNRASAVDYQLFSALITAGQIETAYDLVKQLQHRPKPAVCARPCEAIVNGDLSREIDIPPFDWQTLSNAEYGAALDVIGKKLSISALPNSGGLVARQLIQLQPSNYQLIAKLTSNRSAADNLLRIRLTCAKRSGDQRSYPAMLLRRGTTSAAYDVSGAGCAWFWLDIEVIATSQTDGSDVALTAISLREQ